MAKSRWQQFADNFNSTYGAVTNVAKGIETSRVMGRDYEDEEGNPLQGEALRSRRYEALADIYSKYGDAEGALGLMTRQEKLRSARMGNEITEATKDDTIANAGLQNQALRARIAASNRSGSGSRRLSDGDLFARAVTGALAQVQGGGTGGQLESPPGRTNAPPSGSSDESPRRDLPGAGLSTPGAGLSTPGASPVPPSVGGSPRPTPPGAGLSTPGASPVPPSVGGPPPPAPRQESRALPITPTISTRGSTPGQSFLEGEEPQVRVAGLSTANDASPSRPQQESPQRNSPQAQTRAPTQPGLEQTIADKRMEVEAKAKNKPLPKSYQKQRQEEADQSGEFLLSLAEQFRMMGRPEWVDKTIQLYEQRGEIEAARILRDTQRTQTEMKAALQQDGSLGGIAVLDRANGDARDLELEEGAGGNIVVMEYFKDETGTRVGKRPLLSAANEEELQAKLWARTQDPQAAVETLADVYDAQTKLVELQNARALSGATVREGLANADEAEMNAATAGTNARVAAATAPDKVNAAGLANESTEAAIEKTNADIEKTRQEIAQAGGNLSEQQKIAWDGLRQLLQSPEYLASVQTDPAQAAEMRAAYERAFRMEGAPPVGVPAINWYNLTPAEREEFIRESTGPRTRN